MIATSGKHSYKMCVKSTTRKQKLTTKNEDRNVTNANCNSLYMLVTMIMSVSDNKRQSIVFLVRDQLIGLGKEPMSGSMHFSYQAFVTAFLQTNFFSIPFLL